MKISVLIISLLIFLSSCTRRKSVKLGHYFQDFENITMWVPALPTVSGEFTRNGYYAMKTDGDHPYSQGFNMSMKEIHSRGFTKAIVSAWGAISDTSARCQLVLSIEGDGRSKVWTGIPLREKVDRKHKWKELKTTFDLTEGNDDDVFKVYVWNTAKAAVYFDDISIEFRR